MKPVTIKKIKDELHYKSPQELVELCLKLSKFKKENKELLTYLLFDAEDEEMYINNVNEYIIMHCNGLDEPYTCTAVCTEGCSTIRCTAQDIV